MIKIIPNIKIIKIKNNQYLFPDDVTHLRHFAVENQRYKCIKSPKNSCGKKQHLPMHKTLANPIVWERRYSYENLFFLLLQCSHQCGRKGRQIRQLFCYDRNAKRVGKFNCPKEFKPQRKHKCNQRRCGPLTCLEAQKRFKSPSDREYTLLVGGKNMSIYCHDMSTSEPREYLTLPAGDGENYAEIYDKR